MRLRLLLGLLLCSGLAWASGDWWSGEYDSPIVSSFPGTTSGHLPYCGEGCLMQFTVGTDGGCQAVNGNGRDFSADMNQGTSPTFAATGFVPSPGGSGLMARTNITDSSACYLPAASAVDAGLDVALVGNHTVQCVYFSSNAGTTMPFSYGYETEGITLRTSTNTAGLWRGEDAGVVQPTSTTAASQWAVHSVTRSGTTFTVRTNGTAGTATSTIVVKSPAAKNVYLGDYNGGGYSIGGALIGCTLWNNARSAADLTRDEARFMGTIAESRNVTTTRASAAWMDPSDGGLVRGFGVNAGRVQTDVGLLSYAGEANLLAQTTAYDTAATWVPLGAIGDGGTASTMLPAVTANTTDVLDPMGTNQAEKVVFPATVWAGDATGLQQAFTGTAAAWSGSNVYLRTASGTATVYLYAYTGAAAPPTNALATCSVTDSWAPCAWLGATLSAATYQFSLGVDLRATIGTGQTAKAAQTVYVWGAKAALGSVAGPPGPVCGASACSTAADVSVMPSAGLPTTSGKVTQTYRPMHTVTLARCFIDTIASNNGLRLCTDASNQLVLTLGNGTSTTATTSAAQTLTGGTDYRFEVEWGAGNAWVRVNGEVVASTVDGTAKVPTAHATNLAYGALIAGTSQANGWVSWPVWSQR